MNKQYKVTYSRLMAGGQRLIAYNQVVTESDFKLMVNDTTSRYLYIIIKAELLDYDLRELDSVNYEIKEEE